MQKLYYGTVEGVAKVSPVAGIKSDGGTLTLTNCYAAHQAYMAADLEKSERWAIVEIRPTIFANLEPLEGKGTWQKSVDAVGFCLLHGDILSKEVSRVWVFDPKSNWMITRTVVHTKVCHEEYEINRKKLEVVNRWLTGEFVRLDEWLGEQKDQFTKEQRDRMSNIWGDRSGLDLFYQRND